MRAWFPGYAELVGAGTEGVTYFVGSIFFTAGKRVKAGTG